MKGERPRRRRTATAPGTGLAAAAGLAAVIAGFWLLRVLGSGLSLDLSTSDLFLYYLPIYETLYAELRAGSLPTWNPYQLCGLPGLASLQAGFFYPGHLLYIVLPAWPAFALSSIAHLVLLAVAMFALVRRLGIAAPAAFAAALVLAARGRYPQMVVFPNMLEAAAWLPVGALGVLSLARGALHRGAVTVALATGMSLLAGYPQLSVYVVYSWGGLLLILLIGERMDRSRWARATAWFALGLTLGALLAAIQLVPGLELTGEGTRSPGPLTRWEQFPFGWYGPGLAEALADTLRSKLPSLPLSLGAVALVSLPLAVLPSRYRTLGLGSLAMVTIVVLFAIGPATPFFDWIAQLPALGWFRFPRRSLFMADFFVALALAAGWHAMSRFARRRADAGSRDRYGAAIVAISGGAALLVVVLVRPEESFVQELALASPVLAVAALIAVAVAALLGPTRAVAPRVVSRVPLVLVGLLALELIAAELNRPIGWSEPTSLEKYHQERDLYRPIAASSERVWLRSLGIDPALPPKLATYFELRSVGDYEPLNLRRQAEFFTYLMEGRLSPARQGRPYSGRLKHLTTPTYPGAIEARGHLLDLASVRWFVVSKKAAQRGELAGYVQTRGLLETPIEDPHLVLLENPHAVPRAFVVYDVAPAPEPLELMRRMSEPAFDPLVRSYAERSYASTHAGAPDRGHAAEIVRDERTRVDVAATLAVPGMLVLNDSFYPGWRATVDGRDVEIHAVNHLFRGVDLPAGTHVVRFDYVPKTLMTGASVSLLALVGIVLVWRGFSLRPRLQAHPASDSIPRGRQETSTGSGREST